MEPCAKCGDEAEELIAQPDGVLVCRPCFLGLRGLDEEEYNRLRMLYDRDAEFKKLRHRFWQLGLQRRYNVLVNMGYADPGETLVEKTERFRLYKLKEAGHDGILLEWVEDQEGQILAENEKSEFLAPKVEARIDPSGRVHAGRVNLKPGGSNSNPWAESQGEEE